MNYLAHAYLSLNNKEILVGNMISDFVKGNKKLDYPVPIQKGITLHRSIDRFTDDHPATKQANRYFKPSVRLYAGAFTDVVYDHFLATGEDNWREISLADFSSGVYETLSAYNEFLPQRFREMLPYMRTQDWLFNYQYKWGIEKSFGGVARRALYLDNSIAAFEAFEKHYDELHQLSKEFITDVKKFASLQFHLLMKG
jgi:acyl carrier protein phosphodiesterase